MKGGYQLQAVKPIFTPLFAKEQTDTVFYNKDNPMGCSAGGGVSSMGKGQIVILRRGQCTFVEKVRLGWVIIL